MEKLLYVLLIISFSHRNACFLFAWRSKKIKNKLLLYSKLTLLVELPLFVDKQLVAVCSYKRRKRIKPFQCQRISIKFSFLIRTRPSRKRCDFLPTGKQPGDYREIGYRSQRLRVMENGSLVIARAAEENEGYFLCQASNGIGAGLSKVIHLNVYGKKKSIFRINSIFYAIVEYSK